MRAGFRAAVLFVVLLAGLFFLMCYPAPVRTLAAPSAKAPAFKGKDLQDRIQSLEKFRGKYLVLYFWATWCQGCVTEVEDMKKAYNAFHPKGIEFLTVSLDDHKDRLLKFVDSRKISYRVLFDSEGLNSRIAQLYGVDRTPTYFIINPIGHIVASGSWADSLMEQLMAIAEHPEPAPLS